MDTRLSGSEEIRLVAALFGINTVALFYVL